MSDVSMSDESKSQRWVSHFIFNGYDALIRSNIPPDYMRTLSLWE